MKKTRVSIPEKVRVGPRQTCPIGQTKQTPVTLIPRLKKRNVSVNMANLRNYKQGQESEDATDETPNENGDLAFRGSNISADGSRQVKC